MGESPNPHFYDFGIFGRVPEPQHPLFLYLETPGYFKKSKNNWFPTNIVINVKVPKIHFWNLI